MLRNKTSVTVCGGGILGIAEVGALMKMEELGFSLKNVTSASGSSIGSFISTAIACGATSYYMKQTFENMNMQHFQDNDCILISGYQLLTKYGLNRVEPIRQLATKILTDLIQDPDITFKQLYEKTKVHLTITYLSLNYERTMYADHVNEPDTLVREAIVKSSTIPLFYEAYKTSTAIDCDGGTANNYPMNIPREQNVDPRKIIGLKLVAPKDMDSIDNGGPGLKLEDYPSPSNVVRYLTKIVEILRKQAMRIHVSKNDWMLSVKINIGKFTSTSFEMTKEEQEWLFNQGKVAVDNYVDELELLLKEGKFPY